MEAKIKQFVTWIEDKKGMDIKALDVRGISPLTEGMIFVTARSAKHAQALADEIMHRVGEKKWPFFGAEGLQHGGWVLIDCNDVIVHIFQSEERVLYNVEGLYAKAKPFALTESAPVQEG